MQSLEALVNKRWDWFVSRHQAAGEWWKKSNVPVRYYPLCRAADQIAFGERYASLPRAIFAPYEDVVSALVSLSKDTKTRIEEAEEKEAAVSRTPGKRTGFGGTIPEAQADRESGRGGSDKPQAAIRVTERQLQSVIRESLPQTTRMRLIYQSDLTQPTGWDEGHSDKVKVFRLDGYYHIAVYDGPHSAWFNPALILDDFKPQVDVESNIQSGKTADCGMVFCVEDRNTDVTFFFCAFTVSRNGFYRLHRSSKTEAKAIIDWHSTELIHPGDAPNLLMIEKSGKTVTLGINGQIVATTTDNGFRPGSVGMFVRSYKDDLYAEARFRNFLLYAS